MGSYVLEGVVLAVDPSNQCLVDIRVSRYRVIQDSTRFTPCYELRHFCERFPQSERASFPRRIHKHPRFRRGDYSATNAPERRPKRKPAATRRPAQNAMAGIRQTRRPTAPQTIPRYALSSLPPRIDPAAPPATSASATARAPTPAANRNSNDSPIAPSLSTC